MVSYYNALPYSQKHSAANLAYSAAAAGQAWNWTPNYHTPPSHQFLSDMDSPHSAHHQVYYNPHMFHSAAAAASGGTAAADWHTPPTSATDNFGTQATAPNAHQLMQQTLNHHHHHHHQQQQQQQQQQQHQQQQQQHQQLHHQQHAHQASSVGGGLNLLSSSSPSTGSTASSNGGSGGPTSTGGNTHLNETQSSLGEQHINDGGLPSPPITIAGSEISSPGAPVSPHHIVGHHLSNSNNNNNNSPTTHNNNNNTSTHNNNNRASPTKPQYYDWMKKPSYPAQPQPGKTRTKDKYRVVYTDYQRLELEKEYCTSRYITIRRKSELASSLQLSERQVKIWFQNRRAKERKQNKKGSDSVPVSMLTSTMHSPGADYGNLLDAKTKLEPGLHLQHQIHSMQNHMAAMSMPMRLHPHLGHSLAVSAAAAHSAHQQQLHHAAAAASVGTLQM